jgi:hypothetical protein
MSLNREESWTASRRLCCEDPNKQRRWPCEDGGGEWSDESESQEQLGPQEAEKAVKGPHSEAGEET